MSALTTPVRGLVILAKVRSTRKGQILAAPESGSMGGKGKEGTHFYDITVVGGVNVPERLSCSCPASRFGKAKQVKATGACKHIVKAVEHARIGDLKADKMDVIVYSAEALLALAARI
jgi:hypothetical protein